MANLLKDSLTRFKQSAPPAAEQYQQSALSEAVWNFRSHNKREPQNFWNIIDKPFSPEKKQLILDNVSTLVAGFKSSQNDSLNIRGIFTDLLAEKDDFWAANKWQSLQLLIYSKIAECVPHMGSLIDHATNPHLVSELLKIYTKLAELFPPIRSQIQTELVAKIDIILQQIALTEGQAGFDAISMIFLASDIKDWVDTTTGNKIADAVDQVATNNYFLQAAWISKLLFTDTFHSSDRTLRTFLTKVLKPTGLEPFDMENIWQHNIHYKSEYIAYEDVRYHLENFSDLEKNRPGMVKHLYETWGIANVGCYPIDVLIDMYDADQNPEAQNYVMMIMPRADHNGAFFMTREISHLYEQLKTQGYALKIVECPNLLSIIRYAARLRSRFGKAEAAIICGHGSFEDIQLSPYSAVSALDLFYDRKGKILHRGIRRFFKGHPHFIFISCSFGQRIAEDIANNYDVKVTASAEDHHRSNFSATVTNGKLDLDVEYDTPQEKRVFGG